MMTNKPDIHIEEYLPLLEKIARYRHGNLWYAGVRHIEKGEFISEGFIELHKAIAKFDPEKGSNFGYYAFWMVNFGILGFLRKKHLVPKEKAGALKRKKAVIARLEQKLGRTPYETEVAAAMDMTLKQLRTLQTYDLHEFSLDEPISEEGEAPLLDQLESEVIDMDVLLDQQLVAEAVDHCLAHALEPMERRILLLMDLRGFKGPRVVQIVNHGVDLQQVHYLKRRARSKIRICLKGRKIDCSIISTP